MDKQTKIKDLLSQLDTLEHDTHQGTIMPILNTLNEKIEQVSSDAVPPETIDELRQQLSDISTSIQDEFDIRDQDTTTLIQQLRDEITELGTSSETVTDSKLSLLEGKINAIPPVDFTPIEDRLKTALADIEGKIPTLPDPIDTNALKQEILSAVQPSITEVRNDFITNLNKGGGQANRNIKFSGSVLSRYTDLNLLGASFVNNDTTKQADITLPSGGSTNPATPLNAVQYNNAGSFGGSANFIFNGTNAQVKSFDTTLYADLFAGADIGAQVNDAYAALPTAGGVIMLPAGAYSFSVPISFSTNGKRASLRGAPGGATNITYTGTGAAITINNSIPGGGFSHTNYEAINGITLTGNNTSLVSPQIGVFLGGTNGAAGVTLNQVNIQGFGQGYVTDANTYHTMYMNSTVRNCGQNIYIGSANNAGEELQFLNVFCVDVASNTATDGFYIGGASSVNIIGGSIDDCQLHVTAGTLSITMTGVHMENPGQSTYGAYTYMVIDDSAATNVTINGGMIMNGATTNSPTQFINTGAALNLNGVSFYRNGSASAVTTAVSFTSANGTLTWSGLLNERTAVTNLVGTTPFVNSGFTNQTGTIAATTSLGGQQKFPFNSTTVPAIFCGDGTDSSSWLLTAAGGRTMYGYTTSDSNSNESMVFNSGSSKGMSFYVNGTNSSFLTGTNAFWLLSDATAHLSNKITTYNGITAVGQGVPAIYGSGRSTAQTAAVASVATYTLPASDGSFVISANANITAFVAGTFNVTVAYTDETNTAQTLKLNFSSITGTLGIAIAAAGPFEGIPTHIRCKASTAITIATAGTFTSLTYNIEGSIRQIA